MDALTVSGWLIFSFGIGVIASAVERNGFFWGGVSLLFSPVATAVVLALMEVTGSEKIVGSGSDTSEKKEFDPDEHEKKCPACAEYIKLEARVCRYCGHEFSDKEVEKSVKKARRRVLDVSDTTGSENRRDKKTNNKSVNDNHYNQLNIKSIFFVLVLLLIVIVLIILEIKYDFHILYILQQ